MQNEKVMLRIAVKKDTHKVLKKKAVDLEKTMQDIVEELIENWIKKQ